MFGSGQRGTDPGLVDGVIVRDGCCECRTDRSMVEENGDAVVVVVGGSGMFELLNGGTIVNGVGGSKGRGISS